MAQFPILNFMIFFYVCIEMKEMLTLKSLLEESVEPNSMNTPKKIIQIHRPN